MTPDGSAHARFRRALEVRSVLQAETAAREIGRLSLVEAVDLIALMAIEAPDRYRRAERRWFRRLITERDSLTLYQAQLAIACLQGLGGADHDRLADVLRSLAGGRQGSSRHWR
jgi:hypothetical protein